MARKRLIAPQFFTHADLFEAEQATGLPLRIAFAGLWTVADRRGLFEWRPLELKLSVLPYDNANMTDTMLALCQHGFLKVYEHPEHNGRLFCAIPSFHRWQTFHLREKANPLIPQPLSAEHLTSTVPARYQHGASTSGTGTGTGTNYPSRSRKKPANELGRTTWLTPILDAWNAKAGPGTLAPGRAAKALKPIVDNGFTPGEIATRLAWYLTARGDRNAHLKDDRTKWGASNWAPRIETFALTFPDWAVREEAVAS